MAKKPIRKPAKPAPKATKLEVRHYNWGCAFSGTKKQLIAANVARPEHFPRKSGNAQARDYVLPLGWDEWMRHGGPQSPWPLPPHWTACVEWDYKDIYSIRVRYDAVIDMAIEKRTQNALRILNGTQTRLIDAVNQLLADVRHCVEAIPPVHLDKQLGIDAVEDVRHV